MNECGNILGIVLTLLVLDCAAQNDHDVSPDTVIDFSVSRHRGIKGDGSIVYVLAKDNQTLVAYRGQEVLWQVNVINQCGIPASGEATVRYLRLESDQLKVIFGKHDHATINIYTGELICDGADKRVR